MPKGDLQRVADVYNTAVEKREPPRVSVATYFRITLTAAAGRIYRARKRGLIPPWRRPTYRIIDAHETIGTVVPAAEPAPVTPARPGLTDQQRADARKLFADGAACKWCGGIHARACPRIKSMTMNGDGTATQVEFWPHGQWPEDSVLWPEDVEAVEVAEMVKGEAG